MSANRAHNEAGLYLSVVGLSADDSSVLGLAANSSPAAAQSRRATGRAANAASRAKSATSLRRPMRQRTAILAWSKNSEK